jgi:hypothetical protein
MIHTARAQLALLYSCLLLGAGCGTKPGLSAIPDTSQRFVATPSALAVLRQSRSLSGLPGDITFGDPNGSSALYLQFAPEWRARGAPLKGFLTLEPRLGATPDPESVRIEVWRVRSPWQPGALHTWSDKPELAPPYVSALISSSPARTLRLDISELLRFLAKNPALDQGIALIARRGDGHGASFATGISGGVAPRLEVYTR